MKDKYLVRICKISTDGEYKYFLKRKRNHLFSWWRELEASLNGSSEGRINFIDKGDVIEFCDEYDPFNNKYIVLNPEDYYTASHIKGSHKCEMKL